MKKIYQSNRRLIISLLVLLVAIALPLLWLWQQQPDPNDFSSPRLDESQTRPGVAVDPFLAEMGFTEVRDGSTALRLRLSQGEAQFQPTTAVLPTVGIPLSDAETAALLARLPALEADPDDWADFRLPPQTLPAPRPGETVDQPFPPPPPDVAPPAVPDGPLEVLRFAPEGEIPVAPFLSLTFNQPMIPLATLADLDELDVPVSLTPDVPGRWQWLGTQTLIFEYDGDAGDRFPMATEYIATVPAGTESMSGGVLANDVTWRFRTPPAEATSFYPQHTPQPLEPLFFITFNQAVDPDAALSAISLTANGRSFPLRLATQDEIEADEQISRQAQRPRPNHAFAFRAQEPLPPATKFTVTIGPNLPSAEGPLTSSESQSYTFETYAPLRVTDHRCGWYDGECPPLNPFWIEFNNPLDPELFAEEMVRISPSLPGAVVRFQGNALSIQGMTQGRTTYRVTLDADLTDRFGQTLGQETTLTFRVGQAPYLLSGPDQPFVTLDPASTQLSIYTINHERLNLRVYRVTPDDWFSFQTYQQERYRDEPPPPPGELLQERTLTIEAETDALTETSIDFSDVLENGLGQIFVVIEPPSGIIDQLRNRYGRQSIVAWVQATQIGLDALNDNRQLTVWASDLATGDPLTGVEVQLGNSSASTGSDGLAQLDMPDNSTPLLIARQGDDLALLPHQSAYWSNQGWMRGSRSDEIGWYVFDDRGIYRPGEEVFIKGWLRQIERTSTGDVSLLNQNVTLNYRLNDARGNEIDRGQVTLNEMGGFDLRFSLPDNINLGDTYLNLSVGGSSHTHFFQVQEFRTPEFEVTARNETTGPYFVDDWATVAVRAEYFAGGALPNAEVNWRVTATPGHYAPPNWPDFTFGVWTPWWFGGGFGMWDMWPGPTEPSVVETFSGVTDATGNHYLRLDFEEMVGTRPFTLQAEATVFDVNRQAWSARTNLLVHPASLYVGLRGGRTFVPQGQPLEIEAIVTDLEGTAVSNHPITIEASRQEWRYEAGRWQEVAVDSQTCEINSAVEPVSCTFDTQRGGTYQITATITDQQGRANQSQMTRWVSGGQRPTARTVEQEEVILIPDREEYQSGDTAQILVQSPFGPAEGLLTISRDGLLHQERFRIDGPDHTLSIPIVEAHLPNLHLRVDLVGSAARTDDDGQPVEGVPDRPAYASGSLNLSVPPHSRTLSVEAILEESALAPGGATTLNVTVRDAAGQPVPNAELAAVVVDEAVLALTGYQLRNPLDVFYRERPSLIEGYHNRASILLVNPFALADQMAVDGAIRTVEVTRVVAEAMMAEETAMDSAMPEAAMEMPAAAPPGMEDEADPIAIRQDFNPLATFAPAVRTDASGQAQVAIQLPDNLTRYRVMVVAVSERQFGTAESNLTARLPLMVRPSAPRFLNFGDQFELPIVVQNQTDSALTVDVALRVSNLELLAGAGQQVTVPANDRVEVRFPARAEQPGTARFQVAVASAEYADAASGEWPVYTPATTEAFATYGVLDGGAVAQPVRPPTDVFPQFGGLEIGTSSTAVQALTDAVLYLYEYPYEATEPLASRILAVAALRDVLEAFSADGLPEPTELNQAVQRDIELLQGLQNNDGGFPTWERHRESWPYHTIYAAHALHVAQEKGFSVSADGQQRALAYLRQIEQYYPGYYGPEIRHTLSAYAVYVRDLMGDRDVAKAQSLLNEAGLENLSLEAVAWLWPTLADQPVSEDILRHFNNRAVETAAAANFITGYSEDDYLLLHSNRRADAVILDALIDQRPQSDLIPKVVNGLLAHRERGRWGNTQENTFVLLALDRYFRTFESVTPDFVARFWLGEEYVAEHTYVGRTTERNETLVPMEFLVDSDMADLIVGMEGDGRLYYRLGMRYAPTDLQLPPLDRGFVVQRSYEAIDDPDDVYQNEEGVWHIKAGARVRVQIQLVTNSRRYHVALMDPLPAGLEIINPDLAVSESIPADPSHSRLSWWWWPWYEHQNLRDARAEAFTTLLWEGVYSYSYVARATTPGTFIVPPTKAEEMYAPEVFGRSGSDLVVVE